MNDILDRIKQELHQIEQQENVQIVYACESGSRAWGFESVDSDYDVRFLYVHPTEWYLTIQQKRDVIERPIDQNLDISGWDLQKALKLLKKSNPPLLEWLQSPIVYQKKETALERLQSILPKVYSPTSCMYHYLHMAQKNRREYLKGESVWIKKYFYVLRPILACQWIEQGRGLVPMKFETLVENLVQDNTLRSAIEYLIQDKRQGKEQHYGPRIPEISNFIDQELVRLSEVQPTPPKSIDSNLLDQLFVEMLIELNGDRIISSCRSSENNR